MAHMTDGSDGRLDEIDVAVLDQIRAVYATTDPPPADLDDRVRFAITLDAVDVEVARLQEDLLVGSGARSDHQTRTITFAAPNLTVLVSVVDLPDGLVRLDGWLAPPGRHQVELRLGAPPGPAAATADDEGRFVFAAVDHGLAQLVVRPLGEDGNGLATTVVTPSMVL
jgi:hypothetical protein